MCVVLVLKKSTRRYTQLALEATQPPSAPAQLMDTFGASPWTFFKATGKPLESRESHFEMPDLSNLGRFGLVKFDTGPQQSVQIWTIWVCAQLLDSGMKERGLLPSEVTYTDSWLNLLHDFSVDFLTSFPRQSLAASRNGSWH